jgi:hypothetical protein
VDTLSREFSYQLRNRQLLIEGPVPWSLIARRIFGI